MSLSPISAMSWLTLMFFCLALSSSLPPRGNMARTRIFVLGSSERSFFTMSRMSLAVNSGELLMWLFVPIMSVASFGDIPSKPHFWPFLILRNRWIWRKIEFKVQIYKFHIRNYLSFGDIASFPHLWPFLTLRNSFIWCKIVFKVRLRQFQIVN